MNLFRTIACVVWAGAAISSAAPADAKAISLAAPSRTATCNPMVDYTMGFSSCDGDFPIRQTVRFLDASCSQGACAQQPDIVVYVEFIYDLGRHSVSEYFTQPCTPEDYHMIALGSCQC
jgi:hypothetical protein